MVVGYLCCVICKGRARVEPMFDQGEYCHRSLCRSASMETINQKGKKPQRGISTFKEGCVIPRTSSVDISAMKLF